MDGRSYTSNTAKLLKHLPMLHEMQRTGKVQPVMIHLALTNRCNLECRYCSYGGRELADSLTFQQAHSVIYQFAKTGVRGLEITGGGEPTLWKHLNELLHCANEYDYKIGLITNAIKFDWFYRFDLLQWMRASFHGFNEGKRAVIKKNIEHARQQNPNLEVSGIYIWTEGSDAIYPEVAAYAEAAKIPTRVTPDLTAGKESIDKMMEVVGAAVEANPSSYTFLSDFNVKTHRLHDHCWMSLIKPFVFPDGWVYDCPCIGLSPENSKNIGSEYRVCRIEDIAEHYSKPAAFRNHSCQFCKFAQANELIDDIMRPTTHNDFA
jgi:MoaA/NifB/PqqE/SkfB family radical SAM enzyme